MGYATILDIIGSTMMGGLLMLILLRVNISTVENTFNYGGDLSIQQNLAVVTQVIENDFSKIGYCKGQFIDFSKAIVLADTSRIKFLSDIDKDGLYDSVYYNLGPTTDLSNTTNPRDRILYRTSYDTTNPGIYKYPGITIFKLAFYDTSGNLMSCPVTKPNIIEKVQISIKMESAEAYNGNYISAFWKGTKNVFYNIYKR